MKFSRITLLSATAVVAIAFAGIATAPNFAQAAKEQTVTVGGAPMYAIQGHHRERRQLGGPHHAGRRGEGRRPGRHAEGPRPVHRVRADQRGVRQAARRHRRHAAQAREQGGRSTKVLTYHVVAGKLGSSDADEDRSRPATAGELTTVRAARSRAMQGRQRDHAEDEKGDMLQGHDRRRVPVERRDPRDRHRAAAEAGRLVPGSGVVRARSVRKA